MAASPAVTGVPTPGVAQGIVPPHQTDQRAEWCLP